MRRAIVLSALVLLVAGCTSAGNTEIKPARSLPVTHAAHQTPRRGSATRTPAPPASASASASAPASTSAPASQAPAPQSPAASAQSQEDCPYGGAAGQALCSPVGPGGCTGPSVQQGNTCVGDGTGTA